MLYINVGCAEARSASNIGISRCVPYL